jgi:hypothetical protein
VENSVPYGTAKDGINAVQFNSVTTTAMKLEIEMIPDYSAGIYEWSVE